MGGLFSLLFSPVRRFFTLAQSSVICTMYFVSLVLIPSLFFLALLPVPKSPDDPPHPIVDNLEHFVNEYARISPKTKLPLLLDPVVPVLKPVYEVSISLGKPIFFSAKTFFETEVLPVVVGLSDRGKKFAAQTWARGVDGFLEDLEKLLETTTTTTTTTTVKMKLLNLRVPKRNLAIHARAVAVRREMEFCWEGYKKSQAWGRDDVRPISGEASDWMGYANFMIESLDTLFLMGLEAPFTEAVFYLADELAPGEASTGAQTTFEIVIRAMGGLAGGLGLLRTLDNSLEEWVGGSWRGGSYGIGGLWSNGVRLAEVVPAGGETAGAAGRTSGAAAVSRSSGDSCAGSSSGDSRRYNSPGGGTTCVDSEHHTDPSGKNHSHFSPKTHLYLGSPKRHPHPKDPSVLITSYEKTLPVKVATALLGDLARDIGLKILAVQQQSPFPPMSIDLKDPENLRKPSGGRDPPGTTHLAEAGSIQMEYWALGRQLGDKGLNKECICQWGQPDISSGSDRAMEFIIHHAEGAAIDRMTGSEPGQDGYVGPVKHTIKYLPPSKRNAKKVRDKKPIMTEVESLAPLLVDGLTLDGPQIHTGTFCSVTARADSYYEYLFKLALFRPHSKNASRLKKLFRDSVKVIETHLVKWSPDGKFAFLGSLRLDTWNPGSLELKSKSGKKNIGGKVIKEGRRVWEYQSRMDHLACFYPGLLLLAYHRWGAAGPKDPDDKPEESWLKLSDALLNTCIRMYRQKGFTNANLSPEYIQFDADLGEIYLPPQNDMHGTTNILRPETLESLYYRHYFDGDQNCDGESEEQEQERMLEEKTQTNDGNSDAKGEANDPNNPKNKTAPASLPPGAREVRALHHHERTGDIIHSSEDGEDLGDDALLHWVHDNLKETTEVVFPQSHGMEHIAQANGLGDGGDVIQMSETRPGCQSPWQEIGWRIFTAFRKHAKAKFGYSSLDVVGLHQTDSQESFFVAETLKYAYLLFAPKNTLDLERWVLSTEAHPYPIEMENQEI